MDTFSIRIQIISIAATVSFLLYIGRLVVRGKLREEYSIIWVAATAILVLFSFWRNGLKVMARIFGVYEALNLVFAGAIFVVLVYLLHLSIVASRLQNQNKTLSQEIALLKQKLTR